eukprot:UC4_evm1s628
MASLPTAGLVPRPGAFKVETHTDIGNRPRQEDRFYANQFIKVPSSPEAGLAFFGVWDGTVDPHASDYVYTRCCDHHLASQGFADYSKLVATGADTADIAAAISRTCKQGYAATDEDLLESCRQLRNHYSSTTSVTAIVASGLLTTAHLGDSRAYLILRHSDGSIYGQNLTIDHKPDDPEERSRIEASGGSIQLLHHHNNKPFIRGGDFDRRKATGERVMQLQYSRAFGGKDLKPYGLSADPTLNQLVLSECHIGLVLASDGVCDVVSAEDCASLVVQAWDRGEDAANMLVNWSLQERAR